jgi:hypothetical protein
MCLRNLSEDLNVLEYDVLDGPTLSVLHPYPDITRTHARTHARARARTHTHTLCFLLVPLDHEDEDTTIFRNTRPKTQRHIPQSRIFSKEMYL